MDERGGSSPSSDEDVCVLVKDLDNNCSVKPESTESIAVPKFQRQSYWSSYWEQQENLQAHLLKLVMGNHIHELTECLTSHPIDLNKYEYMDGWSLLHHAVNKAFYSIVALLLLEGINKNEQTQQMKSTPLHLAVLKNLEEVTQLLLEQGADPNLVDDDLYTPLHYATEFGYYSLVKVMINCTEATLDLSARNHKGQTPFDCCKDGKILKLLYEYDQKHQKLQIISNQIPAIRKCRSRADYVQKFLLLKTVKSTSILQKSIAEVDIKTSLNKSGSKNQSLLGSKIQRHKYKEMSKLVQRSVCSFRDFVESQKVQSLQSYTAIRKIGAGGFGKIILARLKNSSKLFAVKILDKHKIRRENLKKYAYAERKVLKEMKHPFIMHAHSFFQDSSNLYMVLEFCAGGDLQKQIRIEPFSEEKAKLYACEVILALEELHRNKILFRDLKAANVLLSADGHVKVTDFGLAKNSEIAYSFLGSFAYLAPEMLSENKVHSFEIDWYLLGVFIYEMLVGLPPFYSTNQTLMFRDIRTAEPRLPEHISKQGKSLLKNLLKKDPKTRLGYKGSTEVKSHPWFSEIDWNDVLQKKLPVPELNLNQKQLRRKGYIEADYIDEIDRDFFEDWNYYEPLS